MRSLNPQTRFSLPRSREITAVSLPNASFAFTRASLIACIPLVAFAIFLQKFSSSLSGISAGRATTERNGGCVCRASWRASVPWVSHRHTAGFPRTSRGLSRENYRRENTAPATSSTIPGRPCALTRSRVRPRCRRREMSILFVGAKSWPRSSRSDAGPISEIAFLHFNYTWHADQLMIPTIFRIFLFFYFCGDRFLKGSFDARFERFEELRVRI